MPAGLVLAAAIVVSLPSGGVRPEEKAAYDALLASQARAANRSFTGADCADAKVEPISVRPWRIADSPGLIVWREKVRVSGCGHTAIENVNVGRTDATPPWRMSTGLPGATLADMTLQGTAWPAAVGQARAGIPADCQAMTLDDTYVAARPGDVDLAAPGAPTATPRRGHPGIGLPETVKPMLDRLALTEAWMEVWPLTACGHDRTLGVVFIPLKDHSATAYLFLPIWQQVEAHSPGARPAAVSAED